MLRYILKVNYQMNSSMVLLFLLGLFAACFAMNGGSYKERSPYKLESSKPVYNGLGNANGDYQMKQSSASKQVESKTRHTGVIGLSAWGIIGVVGGSMLLGTIFYYAVLFYPILCKKERKNRNEIMVDCCPTAPPATDSTTILSTPV